MQVVAQWTGGHADALRLSLRMPHESFAGYLVLQAHFVTSSAARLTAAATVRAPGGLCSHTRRPLVPPSHTGAP
jgi:hypothetical protein